MSMIDDNDESKSRLFSIFTIRNDECRYVGGWNQRTRANPSVQLRVVHRNVSIIPYLTCKWVSAALERGEWGRGTKRVSETWGARGWQPRGNVWVRREGVTAMQKCVSEAWGGDSHAKMREWNAKGWQSCGNVWVSREEGDSRVTDISPTYLDTPFITAVKIDPHLLVSDPTRDLPSTGSPDVKRIPQICAVFDFVNVPKYKSNTVMSFKRWLRHKMMSAICWLVGTYGFAKPCTLHTSARWFSFTHLVVICDVTCLCIATCASLQCVCVTDLHTRFECESA